MIRSFELAAQGKSVGQRRQRLHLMDFIPYVLLNLVIIKSTKTIVSNVALHGDAYCWAWNGPEIDS